MIGESNPLHAALFFCESPLRVPDRLPRLTLGFSEARCCGGLFATTFSARSKRSHASGTISMPESPTFTAPEDEAFFAAIGRLAVAWAHIEISLDAMIAIVHDTMNGGELIEPEKPISLQRKLRYLRRAFNRMQELQPFNERFRAIADEVKAASEDRHDIIHGFVVDQTSGTGRALMVRLLPGADAKGFVVTTETILRAAVRAVRIHSLQFFEEVSMNLGRK